MQLLSEAASLEIELPYAKYELVLARMNEDISWYGFVLLTISNYLSAHVVTILSKCAICTATFELKVVNSLMMIGLQFVSAVCLQDQRSSKLLDYHSLQQVRSFLLLPQNNQNSTFLYANFIFCLLCITNIYNSWHAPIPDVSVFDVVYECQLD